MGFLPQLKDRCWGFFSIRRCLMATEEEYLQGLRNDGFTHGSPEYVFKDPRDIEVRAEAGTKFMKVFVSEKGSTLGAGYDPGGENEDVRPFKMLEKTLDKPPAETPHRDAVLAAIAAKIAATDVVRGDIRGTVNETTKYAMVVLHEVNSGVIEEIIYGVHLVDDVLTFTPYKVEPAT
jgi:hypothetical protein